MTSDILILCMYTYILLPHTCSQAVRKVRQHQINYLFHGSGGCTFSELKKISPLGGCGFLCGKSSSRVHKIVGINWISLFRNTMVSSTQVQVLASCIDMMATSSAWLSVLLKRGLDYIQLSMLMGRYIWIYTGHDGTSI